MDCKIAENYLKEKSRMSKYDAKFQLCMVKCENCPLSSYNNGKHLACHPFERIYPEEAIAIVQKWSDEHPQKTYADDFLEKFPNAYLIKQSCPQICRMKLYGGECMEDCDKCWNEVMEVSE